MPIYRFVNLPGLPDDIKKVLGKDLVDFVTEIKNTLKNNVSKVNNERDKMMIMLSSFELPVILPRSTDSYIKTLNNQGTEPGNGRKILF